MVMHAVSLGINGKGVLLAGPGGPWQIRHPLAGVAHGLQSVGDDYCVVSAGSEPLARRRNAVAPSRQHKLLRDCFHVDSAKARNMADRWFNRFDLNYAAYPEHRLLVRLLARFPALSLAPTTTSRIAGLNRQLWVRGNMNLKTAMPARDTLGGLHSPRLMPLPGGFSFPMRPQPLGGARKSSP